VLQTERKEKNERSCLAAEILFVLSCSALNGSVSMSGGLHATTFVTVHRLHGVVVDRKLRHDGQTESQIELTVHIQHLIRLKPMSKCATVMMVVVVKRIESSADTAAAEDSGRQRNDGKPGGRRDANSTGNS
jgi:hypothetical protein